MNGVKHVNVTFKGVQYELEFDRNITVIRGNGATGKTTLVDAMYMWLEEDFDTVKIESDCKIDVLRHKRNPEYIEKFRGTSNTLFFIDEGYQYLGCEDFAREFYASGNYLVVIDRSGAFKGLSYAIGAIYVLETTHNGRQYITRLKHKYVNGDVEISPTVILTEDQGSGYELLKRMFSCRIESAKGKDNIPSKMEEFCNERLYTIVDGAAFGSRVSQCIQMLSENVLLFAPESFEYLCLKCKPFYSQFKKYLNSPSDYIDITRHTSWEQYFTYLLNKGLNRYGMSYKKSGKQLCTKLTETGFLEELREQFKDIRG